MLFMTVKKQFKKLKIFTLVLKLTVASFVLETVISFKMN
ncbi:ORF150 [Staphylococcus phage 187]|uniref:ORF150 n=1 Tax=Staphylococcus phage 187 TaxID=2908096 RepID=Q4ZDZ3_9CAUD|nr:ORF150 [Staphylococcus phage 187]AAX90753.1 ORF150 [Staphylococcus phage 187]